MFLLVYLKKDLKHIHFWKKKYIYIVNSKIIIKLLINYFIENWICE